MKLTHGNEIKQKLVDKNFNQRGINIILSIDLSYKYCNITEL
jgi:hypothetical protein